MTLVGPPSSVTFIKRAAGKVLMVPAAPVDLTNDMGHTRAARPQGLKLGTKCPNSGYSLHLQCAEKHASHQPNTKESECWNTCKPAPCRPFHTAELSDFGLKPPLGMTSWRMFKTRCSWRAESRSIETNNSHPTLLKTSNTIQQ